MEPKPIHKAQLKFPGSVYTQAKRNSSVSCSCCIRNGARTCDSRSDLELCTMRIMMFWIWGLASSDPHSALWCQLVACRQWGQWDGQLRDYGNQWGSFLSALPSVPKGCTPIVGNHCCVHAFSRKQETKSPVKFEQPSQVHLSNFFRSCSAHL